MREVRPGRIRRVDPPPRRGRLFTWYARAFGTTRPAMWFARRVLWNLDPSVHARTGGRVGLAVGLPTALLVTRGARTGLDRRHAVIYFHDGDDVVVIASKFGYPEDPAWYHNLVAHADVTLNGIPHRAEVVVDEGARRRLWERADRVLPAFRVYRDRAAAVGRTIPIVRLTR